jgi:hypothetical protein
MGWSGRAPAPPASEAEVDGSEAHVRFAPDSSQVTDCLDRSGLCQQQTKRGGLCALLRLGAWLQELL